MIAILALQTQTSRLTMSSHVADFKTLSTMSSCEDVNFMLIYPTKEPCLTFTEPVGFRCLHKERKPTDSISTQDRTGGDVYQQKREIHVQKKIADNRSKLPTIQPHLPHNSTRRYNPNPRRSSGLCRETRSFCGGYQRPRLVRVPHQGRSYC